MSGIEGNVVATSYETFDRKRVMHILASQVRDQMNAPPVSDPLAVQAQDDGETREAFLQALREIGHGVSHVHDNTQAVFDAADVPALSPHQVLSTPTGERPQLEPQRDDSPVTVAADSRENANTREEEAGIDMHSLEHEDELVERTYDPADEAQARDAAQVEDAVDSADANPELPRTFEPNEDEVVARQALPNPDAEGEPSAELAPLATPLAGLTSESTAAGRGYIPDARCKVDMARRGRSPDL